MSKPRHSRRSTRIRGDHGCRGCGSRASVDMRGVCEMCVGLYDWGPLPGLLARMVSAKFPEFDCDEIEEQFSAELDMARDRVMALSRSCDHGGIGHVCHDQEWRPLEATCFRCGRVLSTSKRGDGELCPTGATRMEPSEFGGPDYEVPVLDWACKGNCR